MALAVLDVLVRPENAWVPVRPTITVKMAGGGEQRASLLSRALRRYTIPMLMDETERQALQAFLEARGWSLESFLWEDIRDSARGTGSPGLVPLTLVSGTTWSLPLTGEYGGDYPIDDENVLVWDDTPSVRTVSSVDTDGRTITVTANGSGNLAADYHYYRRVKFVPGSWVDPLTGLFRTEFELEEVMSNG